MNLRKMLSAALMSALVLCLVIPAGWAAEFIVKEGKPQADIIIPEKPTRMQKLAAEELQKYVEKISGAKLAVTNAPGSDLPVKIYVGKSASTDKLGLDNKDLDHGAYLMKSGADSSAKVDYLALMGKDTDYFQEKPGSGGDVYPVNSGDRKRAVEAWVKKHGEQWSTPFMSYFKAYNAKMGIWSVDEHGSLNAVNDFLRSLGVEWYMPGDFGEILPKMASIPLPKIDKTVRPEFASRHMGFYQNAPFQASPDEMLWQLRLGLNPNGNLGGHGIANMLGPEKVKKEHPEYFALYGGKRETESRGGKPCYSSQGLMESSLGFTRLMFDHYKEDIVSLMPTDGYAYFCQCDLCKGKDTPARGYDGMMSDYVWDFINRAAAESAKTHPGKKISCYAYSTYLLPPEKIENFHPNVAMGICQHRSRFCDPAVRKKYLAVREEFLKKLPGKKIGTYDYYLDPRAGVPVYFPRIIAEDMKWLKGKVHGEYMEVYRSASSANNPKPDPALAANHLNLWLTARLYWDPDRDAEAMLAKYFRDFYGPAEKEMKAFVEFCEKNHTLMRSKVETIDAAFKLLAKAQKAAGVGNIHADRVQLLAELMSPLRELREKLEVGRKNNPVAMLADRGKEVPKLDGNFDDAFWKDAPSYELRDLKTGAAMTNKASFKMAWANDSLYFAIRCDDSDMKNIYIPATKNGDSLIFDGDAVEIELESPSHSYYQIAIDPAGHVIDLDRKSGFGSQWESGIEAVVVKNETSWSIEARLPVMGATQEELNPELGISGDKPTSDTPWYFNVCRLRKRDKVVETSAFSPTETGGFHNVMKFGKLSVK
ncbi:MAG: DUF4838 domain-containing protein [Kiritimatiellia bacterium]